MKNRYYDSENDQFGNNSISRDNCCKNHRKKIHKAIISIALIIATLLMTACGFSSNGDSFFDTSSDLPKASSDTSDDIQQEPDQPSSTIEDDSNANDPLAGLTSDIQTSSEAPIPDDKPDYGSNPNVSNSIGEYQSNETSEMLRLVNFYNRLPSDYEPEITEINGERKFSVLAADALQQMIDDCNQAMGKTKLWAQSTYRSYEKQTKLYEKEIKKWENKGMTREEAEKKAATIVAIPGTSEHNTGLCCDFNTVTSDFADTKMYTWLIEHCHEYGFIERYPQDKQDITGIIWEPWHYRYVGVEAATEIKQNGWCLEEYHYYNNL